MAATNSEVGIADVLKNPKLWATYEPAKQSPEFSEVLRLRKNRPVNTVKVCTQAACRW